MTVLSPRSAMPALWTVTTLMLGSCHAWFTSSAVSMGLDGNRATGAFTSTVTRCPSSITSLLIVGLSPCTASHIIERHITVLVEVILSRTVKSYARHCSSCVELKHSLQGLFIASINRLACNPTHACQLLGYFEGGTSAGVIHSIYRNKLKTRTTLIALSARDSIISLVALRRFAI